MVNNLLQLQAAEGRHHASGHGGAGRLRPGRQPAVDGHGPEEH